MEQPAFALGVGIAPAESAEGTLPPRSVIGLAHGEVRVAADLDGRLVVAMAVPGAADLSVRRADAARVYVALPGVLPVRGRQ